MKIIIIRYNFNYFLIFRISIRCSFTGCTVQKGWLDIKSHEEICFFGQAQRKLEEKLIRKREIEEQQEMLDEEQELEQQIRQEFLSDPFRLNFHWDDFDTASETEDESDIEPPNLLPISHGEIEEQPQELEQVEVVQLDENENIETGEPQEFVVPPYEALLVSY